MRVLSWNLFHGRSKPNARRSLLNEFARTLAGWDWDVALLQEVPPWWPPMLAQATGSEKHSVLTSRNFPLAIRRAIAARNPDLIKAGGGGANTILVRGGGASQHRRTHLAWLPERRLAHGVLLRDGTWLVNLHASVRPKERIPRDVEKARVTALAWAGARPLIVGGDFNLRRPDMPWFHHVAGNWVDHVYARGWTAEGNVEVPDPRPLSDHRPIAVTLARA